MTDHLWIKLGSVIPCIAIASEKRVRGKEPTSKIGLCCPDKRIGGKFQMQKKKRRKRGPCCSGMKRIKIVWQVRDVGLWDIYELSVSWELCVCPWVCGDQGCVQSKVRVGDRKGMWLWETVWGVWVWVWVCVRRVWKGMWMDCWRVVAVSLYNFHLLVLKFPWSQFYYGQQPWAYRADIKQPLQSNILPVCKLHLKLGEKRPENGFVRKEKKKKRKPQWSFKLVWINL